jgi:endo-1,4-beta-D-glucanase Y
MRYYEFAETIIKPQKPLTPDQARIEGMKNQVKNTQKAIKAEKARQKIKAGQTALSAIAS